MPKKELKPGEILNVTLEPKLKPGDKIKLNEKALSKTKEHYIWEAGYEQTLDTLTKMAGLRGNSFWGEIKELHPETKGYHISILHSTNEIRIIKPEIK